MHQKFWDFVALYQKEKRGSSWPKAILHTFRPQVSQMPKLYKAMFFAFFDNDV